MSACFFTPSRVLLLFVSSAQAVPQVVLTDPVRVRVQVRVRVRVRVRCARLRGSSERGVDQFQFEFKFGSTTIIEPAGVDQFEFEFGSTTIKEPGGWTGSSWRSSSSSDRQQLEPAGGGPVRARDLYPRSPKTIFGTSPVKKVPFRNT